MKSRIRAVHDVSDDDTFMGIHLDYNMIIPELPRKSVSEYVSVPSGDHILSANVVCPPDTECELDPSVDRFSLAYMLDLEPGVSYTVVIYGPVEQTLSQGKEKAYILVIEDQC